jgi:hypothetical protein
MPKESTYPIRFTKKRKPVKDIDIEVDIIKTGEGLKVVRSGTDRELDWRVGGFNTEELALKMRDELEMDVDVYVIPVRRTRGGRDKEYNLHIMKHPFKESATPKFDKLLGELTYGYKPGELEDCVRKCMAANQDRGAERARWPHRELVKYCLAQCTANRR